MARRKSPSQHVIIWPGVTKAAVSGSAVIQRNCWLAPLNRMGTYVAIDASRNIAPIHTRALSLRRRRPYHAHAPPSTPTTSPPFAMNNGAPASFLLRRVIAPCKVATRASEGCKRRPDHRPSCPAPGDDGLARHPAGPAGKLAGSFRDQL